MKEYITNRQIDVEWHPECRINYKKLRQSLAGLFLALHRIWFKKEMRVLDINENMISFVG